MVMWKGKDIPICVVFTSFYELYTGIEDENVKNFILESIYYTHRINEKLIEYEKEEASG